jgi:hypothetical protein
MAALRNTLLHATILINLIGKVALPKYLELVATVAIMSGIFCVRVFCSWPKYPSWGFSSYDGADNFTTDIKSSSSCSYNNIQTHSNKNLHSPLSYCAAFAMKRDIISTVRSHLQSQLANVKCFQEYNTIPSSMTIKVLPFTLQHPDMFRSIQTFLRGNINTFWKLLFTVWSDSSNTYIFIHIHTTLVKHAFNKTQICYHYNCCP